MKRFLNRLRYLNEMYDGTDEPWRLLICIAIVMPAIWLIGWATSVPVKPFVVLGCCIWLAALAIVRMLGWRR